MKTLLTTAMLAVVILMACGDEDESPTIIPGNPLVEPEDVLIIVNLDEGDAPHEVVLIRGQRISIRSGETELLLRFVGFRFIHAGFGAFPLPEFEIIRKGEYTVLIASSYRDQNGHVVPEDAREQHFFKVTTVRLEARGGKEEVTLRIEKP